MEVDLTAGPSRAHFRRRRPTAVWAYNKTVPGPTIEANVGDRLRLHFCNDLPAADEAEGAGATTIHFHGIDNDATMDGSNISQLHVQPGDCFDYDVPLLTAGTFWYHSHIESAVQVERGLYGALIVRDPAEDAALGLPTDDTVLVLDDVLLDERGQIAPKLPDDALARAKTLLDGREGNTLLVNGREAGRMVTLPIGKPQRWRIVNVANARFMRLSFPGVTAWRIGGDQGLLERPERILPIPQVPDPENPGATMSDPDPGKGLLLTPGERAEVLFTPTGHGRHTTVEWHDFPRGRHGPFRRDDGTIGLDDDPRDGRLPPETLLRLRLTGRPGGQELVPPETLRPVNPIDTTGAKVLQSTFGHSAPDPTTGDVTMFVQMVDGQPRPFDAVTPDDAQSATQSCGR